MILSCILIFSDYTCSEERQGNDVDEFLEEQEMQLQSYTAVLFQLGT